MRRVVLFLLLVACALAVEGAPGGAWAAPKKPVKQPEAPATDVGEAEPPPPADFLEPVNRVTFAFNDGLDLVVVNPLVTVWTALLPSVVRTGVSNVFNNLDDVYVGVNHVLQGNGNRAALDFERLAVNTTVGLGGLFDVGAKMGIAKTDADFGQTLGVWGVPVGSYFVLPLIGPSTLRDAAGRTVRIATDPRTYLQPVPSYSLVGAEYVELRAEAKANEGLIAASSLDRYVFVRNLYLQRRALLVKAGQDAAAGK
jgi:phospholipid-binding lipoprotein MlaA